MLVRSFQDIRHNLAQALIVTRREVIDQLRDWRIILPLIVLTLFFPLLMNYTASEAVNFVTEHGAPVIGDRLVPFLLMIVGFFPISISLVIALESFVGEKERHSLEPLLSSPLTDLQLYIGKTLASMLPPLVAAFLGITVYLCGLLLTIHWVPNLTLLIQIVGLTTIQALVMVSGAVVISAQATSVRAANLMSSFIVVPMALLIQGESIIMFWAQYDVLWWAMLGLVLVVIVLIRMGIRLFNREELLGRDLDEINFRAAWATFSAAFKGRGQGRGWLRWYALEVPATLRRLAGPILIVTGVLAAGLLLGNYYASIFQMHLSTTQISGLKTSFGERLAQFGLVSPLGAGWVLFTNLRALSLATLLGMFSLGILGLISLMIPLALTGYLGGQMALMGISPLVFYGAFILPHGIFEIPAAILEGAVILRLGACILAPPAGKTLGDGWLMALADWAKVSVALVVPLLVAAALMEALVTPRIVQMVFGG
jgi:uncharacterized membrane protein SpoIIM required for sporulation/ABC-type transport system involved in multi-copper enzyme maturation permease subunit